MRRFIYIMLCAVMLCALLLPSGALAAPSKEELDSIKTPELLLMEADTGAVLYEKNGYDRVYPASTTKIMTCIVALDTGVDVKNQYTCGWESQNGFGRQSSLLGLKYGYTVTIEDMLYGLMLCSGNDCGACLAVATAGSIESFVGMMNQKAQEIGMTGTHFTNPHGLHDEEHYTTAYDMALLMKHALKNQTFLEIIKAKEYTVVEAKGKMTKTIQSSNKMIYTKPDVDTEDNIYQYALGGKTGETNVAGYCVVEAAAKDGVTLIAVSMGDPNNYATSPYNRFHNARKLFEYGFEHYVRYDSEELKRDFGVTNAFNIQTTGYPKDDPNGGKVTAEVDISSAELRGLKEELDKLTAQNFYWHEPEIDEEAVRTPVEVGDILGKAALYYKPDGGEEQLLCEGELMAVSGMRPETFAVVSQNPSNIVDDSSTGRRDVCNLTVSKNGGNPEYTVWIYYQNALYTMQDGLTSHYMFYDGEVFRSARVPAVDSTVMLYKVTDNGDGTHSYFGTDQIENGASYVVVSRGMALEAVKKGRSLKAYQLETDSAGNITGEVPEDAVWTFNQNGTGWQLTSGGLYLHRSGGDGLLFWILIAVLVISLAIVIHLLVTGKRRRRNPKRRGKYKIYRM